MIQTHISLKGRKTMASDHNGKAISYICKRTIVSTKTVQPGKHHTLSVFDCTMEHNSHRIVYYYGSSPLENNRKKIGEITKSLRESLSEVLTYYPMVTGRLVRKEDCDEWKWMVKCNDAGVRMVEAKVKKGSVEEWLDDGLDREKEMNLVHWEDMFDKPYFWSTFYVQITEFEEGGVAIGLSCIHLLADPICVTMLINAWANVALTGKMVAPPLFHPLPPRRPGNEKNNINHKPYTNLINHYKSSIHCKSTPVTTNNAKHATTITLAFSDQMVRACMVMARTSGAPQDKRKPSPFEALAGLFWVCISKMKKMNIMDMSICLDVRKVLGLDKGYFGNCMVYNKVHANGLKLKNNGLILLQEATKGIGEVVEKMESYKEIMDLIEWLASNEEHCYPSMNGCDLLCTSLEGVNPYLAMFEEGFAPIRVSYYVEPFFGEGHVLIFPSPPETSDGPLSRVVMVTLADKDEAVRLCEDDLIMQFSPTIVMGVNKRNAT